MPLRDRLIVASPAISKNVLRCRPVSAVNDANGYRTVGAAIANVVGRIALALCLYGALSACAESVHQTERRSRQDFMLDPGYAGAQSYAHWPGPGYGPGYGIGYGAGYWGNPLGYYGLPYGPMDQAEWDGMADMEASARHVRRVVRRPHGQPYLPIRLRGLEKFTEWSAQFTSRGLLLIFICRAAQ
jgi:hypothetical protein